MTIYPALWIDCLRPPDPIPPSAVDHVYQIRGFGVVLGYETRPPGEKRKRWWHR